jgi:hypothetical protein
MSFPRHGEIYRSDMFSKHQRLRPGAASRWSAPEPSQRTRRKGRVPLIVRDEFPVGYSLAGCSPAEPASASPTAPSMRWGLSAGKCLSANGNLSLISVSQARGSLHSPSFGIPRQIRAARVLGYLVQSLRSGIAEARSDLASLPQPRFRSAGDR